MKHLLTLLALVFATTFYAQTFTDNSGPHSIQNGNGILATCGTAFELELPLTVSGVGTLNEGKILKRVTLNITHPNTGELIVKLRSPQGGYELPLAENVGGTGNNFINTFLTSTGGYLSQDEAPFTDEYYADINIFNYGTVANGDWTLIVCDSQDIAVGTVDNWSLTFEDTPSCLAPSAPFIDDATGITATTANLTWITIDGTFSSNDIEVINIDNGETLTGTPTVSNIMSQPYQITGLLPDTNYEVYVRSNCDASGFSEWAGPRKFKTFPDNDIFSGANPITPLQLYSACNASTEFTLDFTYGITDSGMSPSCYPAAGRDQFFSWTATTDALNYYTNNAQFPSIAVYDAIGNELDCSITSNSNSQILSGWTIGDAIIIQIFEASVTITDALSFCLSEFELCTTPTYANTGLITPTTAEIFTSDESAEWNFEYGITGFTFGNGTMINTTDFPYVMTNLTPNTTYDVYVQSVCSSELSSGWGGPFQFTTPLSSDACSTATQLTVGATFADNAIDGSNALATTTSGLPISCGFTSGPDVWYAITVPADGNLTIETAPDLAGVNTNFNTIIEAYSGECGALVSIGCNENDTANNDFPYSQLDLTNLTSFSTVYVRVWGYLSAVGPFSISAYSPTYNVPLISMVGTAVNGWPGSGDSSLDVTLDLAGTDYYTLNNVTLTDGELKFRTNYDWAQPSYGGTTFPTGTFAQENIQVEAGIYDITFNLATNEYAFNPTSSVLPIGIVGPAGPGWPVAGNASLDVIMTTVNSYDYYIENYTFTDGDLKFRENYNWATNWGGSNFPSGIATLDGPNIPVTAGNYNLHFNRITGVYSFEVPQIVIKPKVILQGAYLNPNVGEETLMRDDLRVLNLIPTTSPYADGLTCDPSVFNNATNIEDNIVDWVWIELTDPNFVFVVGQSALLQRDGDIVDVDGTSLISFGLQQNAYNLAVKHRNHLGVSTGDADSFSFINPKVIDFTDYFFNNIYGTNGLSDFGMPANVLAMWAGNAGGDITSTKYQGSGNDSNAIKDAVLADAGNTSSSNLYSFIGYNNADVNMDGTVKYQGSGNDSNTIKDIVLSHPNNTSTSNLFTVEEQLPSN